MQMETTPHSEYEVRTTKVKEEVEKHPHEICIERAKLITESYKKSNGEQSIKLITILFF